MRLPDDNLRVHGHLGLEHELVDDAALFQDLALGFWEEEEPAVYYGVEFGDRLG